MKSNLKEEYLLYQMFNYQKIAYFKNQSLSSFLWVKYSPHKRQPPLTLLWEVGALPQGDLPRFNSLSLLSQCWTLRQVAVTFFVILLTFQNIVYFPPAWLMSGEELIQRRHTRQLALGRAILSLCCWQREQEERRRWPALQRWQQGRAASGRAGMVPGPLLGQHWVCIVRPLQEQSNFADIPDKHLYFILPSVVLESRSRWSSFVLLSLLLITSCNKASSWFLLLDF